MIVKGLENIISHMYTQHNINTIAWYEHHPEVTRGIRPDVYASIMKGNKEKKRIFELEEEIKNIKNRESDARASYEMHMAMGCDDRNCQEC